MEVIQKVKAAIAGDDEAFISLIDEFKIDLYKTAYAYLKNEHDSLEALQEVTYRAYKAIGSLRTPAYFKTWLIRIMINYCQDTLKKTAQHHFNDEMIRTIGMKDNYAFIEIQEALEKLDGKQRELLLLKYFHDLKLKDIAMIMDRPESTIKTWLTKALSRLKAIMEEEGGKQRVSK
ncbi:sigma-70 family RNA polymerase sigma factor [Jeotgalibacillus proteolyticus]|uniref:RNA polymerase subunit sigma-70 n=1 Tax=Jeotgalibacillus proteolyticus TaxID=2082395 RepID=A0A2S5G7K2_9BACL|nr:sigma-70 family RNA polymerase sigma factor [Jeotgalibacillus proteolyticus]PPA68923.1 RNA polymerase subunit sigma-70 [Jeotgalibacillus proteolyticus]